MTFADLNIELFLRADRIFTTIAPLLGSYFTETLGWYDYLPNTFGDLHVELSFGDLSLGDFA